MRTIVDSGVARDKSTGRLTRSGGGGPETPDRTVDGRDEREEGAPASGGQPLDNKPRLLAQTKTAPAHARPAPLAMGTYPPAAVAMGTAKPAS